MFLFLDLDMEVPNEDFGHSYVEGRESAKERRCFCITSLVVVLHFLPPFLIPFGVYLSIRSSFGLSRNIFIFHHWSSNHYLRVLLFCCCSCGVCWLLRDTCMPFPRYSGRTGFFLRVSSVLLLQVSGNTKISEGDSKGGKEKPSYLNEVDWKKRTPK
ncbi:hypothetical protein GE21DRAFT_1003008 [Neurospora crassa]|nr:hypothetical protein GE21DRAFT_1003008 [Neurospora crassa]